MIGQTSYNTKLFGLRRAGHFNAIMQVPARLYEAIEAYFITLVVELENDNDICGSMELGAGCDDEPTPNEPRATRRFAATVPGLISYLGADRALFFEIRSTDKHKDRFPEESVHYIRQACLLIEDETIQTALLGRGNPAFAKFLLSAYNDASEKTITEQTVNHNHLHITLAEPDSIEAGLGERFRRESERLKGNTSSLINKKIVLGEAAEQARSEITDSEESGEAPLDVEWEDVAEDNDDDFI